MIEMVEEYILANKYILGVLGLLTLWSVIQWWNQRKLKRKMNDFEKWSKELYDYMATLYERRG